MYIVIVDILLNIPITRSPHPQRHPQLHILSNLATGRRTEIKICLHCHPLIIIVNVYIKKIPCQLLIYTLNMRFFSESIGSSTQFSPVFGIYIYIMYKSLLLCLCFFIYFFFFFQYFLWVIKSCNLYFYVLCLKFM